jgi:3-oxoacyl-[acyl-carrier protein] reductase
VQTDVTDAQQVERLMDAAVKRFGGLDLLVIDAGGGADGGPVEECAVEDWLATLDVNLNGAFLCAQKAISHLKRRGGGKIITLGSGMGHRGIAGSAPYCCAKAGLWMLTRVLAEELRPHGICVNELIPGVVAGEEEPTSPPPRQADPANPLSLEWRKAPQDVVPPALFLAAQPEGGPTGQSFSLMRRQG